VPGNCRGGSRSRGREHQTVMQVLQGREQESGERASDCDAGLRPVKDGGGRGTG